MKKFSVFGRKKNNNNAKTETEEETIVPPTVVPPVEATAPAQEAMTTEVAAEELPPPVDHHEDHGDIDDDDDDDDEALDVDEAAPKEWDEGGKSHCGYSDQVHDTLMLIGESIHKVVGEPSETVHSAMKGIGSWFQEASYAARDVQRGKMNVGEEAAAAIKSMVTGDEDDAANIKKEDAGALLGSGEEEGVDQEKVNGGISTDDQRI